MAQPRRNGRVTARRVKPREGWTEEEALDLLAQGYAEEYVVRKTGLPLQWVRAQRVPTVTRLERAAAGQL